MLLHVNYTWAGKRKKKSENICELKYVLNGKKTSQTIISHIYYY